MVKGRAEMQKQKLFKLSLNKVEFELRYAGERIGEIKEEIKELKELLEDGDDEENDDSKIEMKDLRIELKETRQRKKELFDTWKNTTASEESRRALLENENNGNYNNSMSVSDSSEITHTVITPITIDDARLPVNQKHTTSEITEDNTNSND